MPANKLILIPAYNESTNIHRTITEIRRIVEGFDLLVIDDGSTDDTRGRARAAGADVISLPFNLGIGGAVQAGLMYAKTAHYGFAVRLDADGQHNPAEIRAVLEPLLAGTADMVIGSRFLPVEAASGYKPRMTRRAGIFYLSVIVRLLTGRQIGDVTSGFCAWNRAGIDLFAEQFPIDFPEPEAVVIAARAGLRIREVPVVMRRRFFGMSSIKVLGSFYYFFKVSFALLLMTLQRREGSRS